MIGNACLCLFTALQCPPSPPVPTEVFACSQARVSAVTLPPTPTRQAASVHARRHSQYSNESKHTSRARHKAQHTVQLITVPGLVDPSTGLWWSIGTHRAIDNPLPHKLVELSGCSLGKDEQTSRTRRVRQLKLPAW
eukprot:gene17521-biopygen813